MNQRLWTRQGIGWVAAIAIAVVLAGGFFVATWTPSVHDVHTPGATTITKVRVDAANAPAFLYGTPTPTMSLADLRCQVSNNRSSEPCPDPTTLAQRFWPTVAQSPKTIYLGLPASCFPFDSASGLNVEYVGSSRLLLFHCFSARAWFVPPAPRVMGVMAAPTIILVTVPVDAIPAGSLTLVRDDRVEHLLGDDSRQVVLGTVTIP